MAQSTKNSIFKRPRELKLGTSNLLKEWQSFLQRFRIYLEATESDTKPEKTQVAIFLNFIGEEALEVYNTFNFEDSADANKLDVIIDKFHTYCKSRKNVVIERYLFWKLAQHADESVVAFATRLKNQAELCEFGDQLDSMIRDRIVLECSDHALLEQLLNDNDLTLQKTLTMCQPLKVPKNQINQSLRSHKKRHVAKKRRYAINCSSGFDNYFTSLKDRSIHEGVKYVGEHEISVIQDHVKKGHGERNEQREINPCVEEFLGIQEEVIDQEVGIKLNIIDFSKEQLNELYKSLECKEINKDFVPFESYNIPETWSKQFPKGPSIVSLPGEKWLTILETQEGRRLRDLAWTHVVACAMKEVNPYCSFRFRRHRMRLKSSRRPGHLFVSEGNCMFKGCPVRFTFVVKVENPLLGIVTFSTDSCQHLENEKRCRPIRGSMRLTYGKQLGLIPPSTFLDLQKEKLGAEIHESGNRDFAPTPLVLRRIMHEYRTKAKLQ